MVPDSVQASLFASLFASQSTHVLNALVLTNVQTIIRGTYNLPSGVPSMQNRRG